MYIRLCRGLHDIGKIIAAEDLNSEVSNNNLDWYTSVYYYNEDVFNYLKEHNSFSGYKGSTWTKSLHWDIDSKDLESAQSAALQLLEKLRDLNLLDGVECYFSGKKGFHVILRTNTKFGPDEVKNICMNVAREAGLTEKGLDKNFDPVVYNSQRIFRVINTKHPDSGLYKVPIDLVEIASLNSYQVKELAQKPRTETFEVQSIDFPEEYLEKYNTHSNVISFSNPILSADDPTQIDFSQCPPRKRRCVYALEQGYFGPGERENACIRLAAYYKGNGFDKETSTILMNIALERRKERYANLNKYSSADTDRIINRVFSPLWIGGTYTCATDDYLASKCNIGHGPCCGHNAKEQAVTAQKTSRFVGIQQLGEAYIAYGKEALKNYPKTGIEWLDKNIRLRPKNYSIINGSNGSGKTSLALCLIENFNKQKIRNAFFSLDMADTSLFEKVAAKHTTFTPAEIEQAFNQHSQNDTVIRAVLKKLEECYPYTLFDFTSFASSKHIENMIATYNADRPTNDQIQIAIIDYAGRIPGEKDSAYANATANALEANDIAKRTNTHLIYISQIARESGDHTEPIYSSRVSKDSGAWEENATLIINCWRPFGSGISGDDHFLWLYIAKNRSGVLDEHVLDWNGKMGSVQEMNQSQLDRFLTLCEENEIRPPKSQMPNSDDIEERPRYNDGIKKNRFSKFSRK